MLDDFVIARNPDPASSLPYLIRVPLPGRPIVLKTRETWPRTSKVYCHRAESWPDRPDIVDRVRTRACERRGAAIDLVLDRARESRSQIVLTYARGREAIFWQSQRTAKQARPAVRQPTAAAAGRGPFTILVDTHERYPYRFSAQQAEVERRTLPVGDYAVEADGTVVAAVERKSLPDLASSITKGSLRFALGELASLPRAAVVVEDRWSAVFKTSFVRPALVADGLAELQVRWPMVPIVFAETRRLAEEWTYRWLAAALTAYEDEIGSAGRLAALRTAGRLSPSADRGGPTSATTAEVRAWALAHGLPVSDRGRLRPYIWAAFTAAHADGGESAEAEDRRR